jgi:hypothetical protein
MLVKEFADLCVAINSRSAAQRRAVVAVVGPGVSGLARLLETSGASRTLLDASAPYSCAALREYLAPTEVPPSSASPLCAQRLAAAALHRGVRQQTSASASILDLAAAVDVVGVGASGAIATDRARAGKDACNVATQRTNGAGAAVTNSARLVFRKGERGRAEEEGLSGGLVLASLASALEAGEGGWEAVRAGLRPLAPAAGGTGEEEETLAVGLTSVGRPALEQLLSSPSPLSHVLFIPRGGGCTVVPDCPLHLLASDQTASAVGGRSAERGTHAPVLLLPGSFNPFHSGHEAMAEAAAALLTATDGRPYSIVFELSLSNVDKPDLAQGVVEERLRQFVDLLTTEGPSGGPPLPPPPAATGVSGRRWPVVLTRAPRFVEKAALFPGCAFVVGYDTAARLVDAKYYGDDEATMLLALGALVRAGTRFVVAGRRAGAAPSSAPPGVLADTFLTYSTHLAGRVHPLLAHAFVDLPAFRDDVSSSAIRERGRAK